MDHGAELCTDQGAKLCTDDGAKLHMDHGADDGAGVAAGVHANLLITEYLRNNLRGTARAKLSRLSNNLKAAYS